MHKIIIFFSILLFTSADAKENNIYVSYSLHQTNNKDIKQHIPHHDFSYNPITCNNRNWNKPSSYKHFSNYTTHGFRQHFAAHDYTESQIYAAHTSTEPIIRDISLETFRTQLPEYNALYDVYHAHSPLLSTAIENRLNAYKSMFGADYAMHYTDTSYNLDSNVKQLLHKYKHDTTRFTQCYGNQLHHRIHQESLDLLHQIDHLSPHSILYDHQEVLIDFTVAMIDYNHEGLTDKAAQIADFCWTLLDYGQAVAEGAVIGIQSAVTDILNNPIEATISMVASKPLLVYQLSKALYNVADISLTAITSFDQAKDKWKKYTEPLNTIIDKIYNKEISIRDAVKNGTALVVGLKAQSRLLGGLGKFCNTIKQKNITFAQNSSLFKPQEYFTTPEGLLFKATANTNKLKQSGQVTASGLKNNVEKITIWNNIKPTDKMYPGTKIPKSFEITAEKQKFWVCPNATKHMLDYVTKHLDITYTTPINSQTLLTSFQSAVKQAVSNGIRYNTMINVGCWQFRFDAPRKAGLLPSIYHANFKPKGW